MFHKDGIATSSTKDAPLRKSDKRRLRDSVFEAYFGQAVPRGEQEGNKDILLLQSLINEALSISGGGDIVARKLKLIASSSESGTSARAQASMGNNNSNSKKQSAKTGTVTLYLRTPPTGENDSTDNEMLKNDDVGGDFRATRWPYRNTMQPLLLEMEHKYFTDEGNLHSKGNRDVGGGGKKGGKQETTSPSQRIIPCLPLLSIIPSQYIGLPCVLVHSPVSKFLCRGAQLMRSGVQSIIPAPSENRETEIRQGKQSNTHTSLPFGMHNIQKRGTIVAICTTRNPLSPPFALGILVADYPTEMRVGPGAKGICCEIVTCYGDDLWRISRDEAQRLIQTRKGQELDSMTQEWEANANFGNRGFLDGQFVAPLEGSSSEEEEVDETDTHDINADQTEKEKDDGDEPDAAVNSAKASVADIKVQDAKEENENVKASDQHEIPDDSDQDALLLYSFHRALVTTVSDKILPISVAALYGTHILPARPKGTTLDLKRTQFKKMGLFLYAQQQPQEDDDSDGEMPPLIETKPSDDGREAIAFLNKVNRSHPALRRMKQLVKKEKESSNLSEKGEASSSLTSVRKLAIVNLYKIPKKVTSSMKLKADDVAASNATSEARRGTGFLTGKEVNQILSDYIKDANLANKGNVVLDEPLFEAVMKLSHRELNEQKQKSGATLEVGAHIKRKDLQERWMTKMEPAYALVAVPGNEVLSLKKGTPKKIEIEVEKRQGNRKYSTHVRGLEEYGIDGSAFANDVAKRFACSASVDANPTSRAALPKGCVECTFQGHLSEELKALLTGDERICSHGGCRNGTYFVPKVVIGETLRKGVPAKKKR